MKAHVSLITLGVRDLPRVRKFYHEGLGWPILQDYPEWVAFPLGDGSSGLGLYTWEALARDAGVPAEGGGFRGITLSYLVKSDDRVGEVLTEAERAGATIVRQATRAQWGGVSGYFSDPEGYLWKVASGTGGEQFAAE